MDFFDNSLQSPIGQEVAKATDSLLLGPDWGVNMDICDSINRNPENAQLAVKAFRKRLKDNEAKTIQLTLTLAETCVKNCAYHLHEAIASREFMDEMCSLAEGRNSPFEVREQALDLVQQWGLAFQQQQAALPMFYSTYMKLKTSGARFPPPPEDMAPVFTPPPSVPTSGAAAASTGGGGGGSRSVNFEQSMKKLQSDIDEVMDKVYLCAMMMAESRPASTTASAAPTADRGALMDVIGFLEACRPRMAALIDAGMNGALNEALFNRSLEVNDAIQRVLEAEKNGTVVSPDELPPLKSVEGGGPTAAPASSSPAPARVAATEPKSDGGGSDGGIDLLELDSTPPQQQEQEQEQEAAAAATDPFDPFADSAPASAPVPAGGRPPMPPSAFMANSGAAGDDAAKSPFDDGLDQDSVMMAAEELSKIVSGHGPAILGDADYLLRPSANEDSGGGGGGATGDDTNDDITDQELDDFLNS